MHRAATDLAYAASKANGCVGRLSLEDKERLTVLERLAEGDSEAIYDAIVEAVTELESLRERIGQLLSDTDYDALDRIAELRSCKEAGRCTASICMTQETAARDRSGKERRRKAASTGSTPANQG